MQIVTLRVPIQNVIHHISSVRGIKIGKCLACGATGSFQALGYPSRVKNCLGLQHKKECSMNKYLTSDGSPKKRRSRN